MSEHPTNPGPAAGKTFVEIYGPAMEITDQAEADVYFASLVARVMLNGGKSEDEAEAMIRTNLAYYSGYCPAKVRERVEKLYSAEHPVFGKVGERDWSFDEILQAGKDLAEQTS